MGLRTSQKFEATMLKMRNGLWIPVTVILTERQPQLVAIVASCNRVIQCGELQIGLGQKKKTYSKFAMLNVEPHDQNEGVS